MFNKEDIEFINQVIDRNKFYVDVQLLELNPESITIKVNYLEDVIDIYKMWSTGVINYNEENVYIHPSLSRLYVLLHIFKNLRLMRIPQAVVRCKDLQGNIVDNADVIFANFKLNEKDVETEKQISSWLNEIREDRKKMNSFDKELREKQLYHSFNALKGLIF